MATGVATSGLAATTQLAYRATPGMHNQRTFSPRGFPMIQLNQAGNLHYSGKEGSSRPSRRTLVGLFPYMRHSASRSRRQTCCVAAQAVSTQTKVLIVNTNGGGHAPIGFWLSKQLASASHKVTILTVGTEDDKKMRKPPFVHFNELTDAGVQTVWADPADVSSKLDGESFDVVVDNNGKDLLAVGPVLEFAKAAGASQFLFVSSCGVYQATDSPPYLESDSVKPDAGHVAVEQAMAQSGLPWASFRPQYISGYGSNKDCEEWFFDRIARGRPVPIPGSGDVLCNISNAEDLGSMIALAVGNPAAAKQIFNCVHSKGITHDGLVRLCAKVMGVDCPPIVHYNPKEVGGTKAFPFRPAHFYAQPAAAERILGWSPKWTLERTLQERWQLYKQVGRDGKEIDFSMDDEIIAHVNGAPA
mmetsp:Transcript_34906/g.90615  ORF Transcript_34906/g.90615 Transcript_34906/m.90615 type:complete len:416 (+) Transcript_34906:194-1441(+)